MKFLFMNEVELHNLYSFNPDRTLEEIVLNKNESFFLSIYNHFRIRSERIIYNRMDESIRN